MRVLSQAWPLFFMEYNGCLQVTGFSMGERKEIDKTNSVRVKCKMNSVSFEA